MSVSGRAHVRGGICIAVANVAQLRRLEFRGAKGFRFFRNIKSGFSLLQVLVIKFDI